MDAAARDFFARRQGLRPRFAPRKFWEQRRMQIDNAARKRLQHDRLEDAHEPGEHNQFHPGCAQSPNELLLHFRFELRPKFSRRKKNLRDAEFARDLQDTGIGDIRDDYPAIGRQIAAANFLQNRAAV